MANEKTGRSWGVLLMSLFVVWCLSPTHESIGAPVPGGPGFISIGYPAFQTQSFPVPYGHIDGRLYNNSLNPAIFVAPLSLPQGAVITQLVLYFVDNDSTNNITAWISDVNLDTNIEGVMCGISTSGSSPGQRTVTTNNIPNSLVNNQSNYYVVSVLLPPGPTSQLLGVRIDYNYPINLPVVMK